jgi:hypothetical protein
LGFLKGTIAMYEFISNNWRNFFWCRVLLLLLSARVVPILPQKYHENFGKMATAFCGKGFIKMSNFLIIGIKLQQVPDLQNLRAGGLKIHEQVE